MKRRILFFVLIFVFFLGGRVFVSASSQKAILEGRVVNHTLGGGGTANLELTLQVYKDGSEIDRAVAKTDSLGKFTFKNLEVSPDRSYDISLDFQGGEYFSDAVVFEKGEIRKEVEMVVYDATDSDKDIQVNSAHIVVDIGPGELRVKEIIFLENRGNKTYVGKTRFSLPRGASNLVYGKGLMECCVLPSPSGFVDSMDLKPGAKHIQYSYFLKYSGSRYELKRPIDYQTRRVDFLILDRGIEVKSPHLKLEDPFFLKETKYQHWVGKNLAEGSRLEVKLVNLPRGDVNYTWIILGIVTIVMISGFSYFYFRKPVS